MKLAALRPARLAVGGVLALAVVSLYVFQPAGASQPIEDIDDDGVPNVVDNCPFDPNPDQQDTDNDGVGDVCDSCPFDPNNDADSDSICGDIDNCPLTSNTDQLDTDNDGVGDVCDSCPFDDENDLDGDGICGDVDDCAGTTIPEGVPTKKLQKNRFALTDGDGDFDTVAAGGRRGPDRSYSIEDTAGCSCEQIIPQILDPDDQQGHVFFGCSISVMDEWVEYVSQ